MEFRWIPMDSSGLWWALVGTVKGVKRLMDTVDTVKVLVVDDEALVRTGIERLLRGIEGIEVVGVASSGEEAVARARTLRPDVVLMDVRMPGIGGVEATRQIAEQRTAAVCALTSLPGPDSAASMLGAGAISYLLKSASTATIVDVVRATARGDGVVSTPAVAGSVHSPVSLRDPSGEGISESEMEVLELLAKGYDNARICQELYLSPSAVKNRLTRISRRLGVDSRLQIVIRATELGLVQPHLAKDGES